jgi:flagellar M-ring protein FliF
VLESLRERLGPLRERWAALSQNARIGAALALAAALAAAVFGLTRGGEPPYALLYANLDEQDASAIVARLREQKIPYRLEGGGTQVLVAEDKVYDTRLQLASEGLPRGGGVGFEIFDQQRFGESEFSEQVKYHRALEGELSRTISHLAGVRRARVHLVLPQRTLFATDESHASASVVVDLVPGRRPADEQVRGIVHLVASSVRGLAPDDVTVVDGEGRPLAGGDAGDEQSAASTHDVRRTIERAKERAVQQLLDRTYGPGSAMVRVAADVAFSREERTEETFEPTTIATRSFQIVEERNGAAGPTSAGIPGAPSNLPGGAAPENGAAGADGLARRSETRNYEVSRATKRVVEPVGRLARLDVAVVVDGTWSGEGAARRWSPRSPEELARIKTIVESAVGALADRGDRVTVECVRFTPEAAPEALAEDPITVAARTYGPYGAAGLAALALLVGGLWLRRRAKKAAAQKGKPGAALAPVGMREPTLGGVLGGAGLDGLASQGAVRVEASAVDPNQPAGAGAEQANVDPALLAAEIAAAEPKLAAQIVRGWLQEGVS